MLYTTIDHLRTSTVLHRQADAVGDDAASLRVYVVVGVLVVIGLLLIGLAVWLIGQTRPDPELLAPLERMDARQWRKLDPQDRRRALDEIRPAGAVPLDRAKREPKVDQEFAVTRPVRDFSDLVDDETDVGALSDAGANGSTTSTTMLDVAEMDEVASDAVSGDAPTVSTLESDESATSEQSAPVADEPAVADETAPIEQPIVAPVEFAGDDTGEHTNDADVDVPLMPGEGLLRRPRSDADRN